MNNVKIITNYQSDELYSLSKSFYENVNFEKIGVKGSNDFYSFNFLDNIITDNQYQDIDIMIYIDEDCFITNTDNLMSLLEYFIDQKIDCIGAPDGGVIKIRTHNPISINQFFCILNLKTIRQKYDKNEILKTIYTEDLEQYTPYYLLKKDIVFNYDNFEPYYKLFFWMLKNNYKIEYLDAYSFSEETTTTILKNHLHEDFAYHTWYAREWGNDFHKNRIKEVIKYCNLIKNNINI